MIEITFLGTGASVPSKNRSLPCIVIRRKDELIMFDCGEGAQYKFLLNHFGVNRKIIILITHLHGDHVFGLPGLMTTMSFLGRTRPLIIIGPKGIKDFVKCILSVIPHKMRYDVIIHEEEPGIVFETDEYVIEAHLTVHSVVNYMYVLKEKMKPGKFNPEKAIQLGVPRGPLWKELQRGRQVILEDGRVIRPEDVLGPPRRGIKIVYTGDTGPCKEIIEVSKEADVLIHEATYSHDLLEKAIEEGHSTTIIAAENAKSANVKLLILTHISARYDGLEERLLNEAKSVFRNTILAYDGLRITVK